MKIGDKVWKAYRGSCSEKMISIRDDHEKEMTRISYLITMPMNIEGREQHIKVDDMTKLRMCMQQIEKYGRAVVNAHIDAFIEVYTLINECPSQEDINDLIKELMDIAKSLINWMPGHYQGVLSPIPSQQLVQQVRYSYDEKYKTIPGTLLPKLNKFVSEAALRKEFNLPLRDIASGSVNIVSVGRDVNGPIQAGTDRSNQSAFGLPKHQEITEEQESEAYDKISEWLKAEKLGKGKWVNFADIADATGLEIRVIKECIKYAAFLVHMKIDLEQPNAVLISTTFGF